MNARDLLDTIWIVPALPLLGAVVLGLFGRRIGDPRAGWIATGLLGAAFCWSVVMFAALLSLPDEARRNTVELYTWLRAGALEVNLGFLADPLSITWILLVTGVGSLIHLYAIGYMHGDERFSRFFAYFNLFAASMLVLVLASSFLLTFLGWEGVGLCSYLLIGFWFQRRRASSASVKAFVTNRVGDFGFMLAMFFIVGALGSLDYAAMDAKAGGIAQSTATVIALLLFLACIGKSAQIGLHLWLPDAMEGPTPVSALIHAATMVTAGVYLVCRTAPFFERSGDAMTVVAIFGALTALLAGTVALVQPDIKRVLAYSTVSQLGYMFLAAGVGAYSAAVFFVLAHAFYKGTLFLGAGTVIHGTHDEQDIRHMGGLRKYLPFTGIAFVIAWLAISGVPPLAGFWAKDGILASAFFDDAYVVYAIGLFAAALTAIYVTRETLLVFFGNERFHPAVATAAGSDVSGETGAGEDGSAPAAAEEVSAATTSAAEGAIVSEPALAHAHVETASPTVDYGTHTAPTHLEGNPHEGTSVMVFPVLVLATFAIFAGLLNLPFKRLEFLTEFLDPVFGRFYSPYPTSFVAGLTLDLVAIAVAFTGVGIAFWLYRKGLADPELDPLNQRLGALARLFGNAWYYDKAITYLVGGPIRRAADWLAGVFDLKILDGAVNGVAHLFGFASRGLRRVQTGLVRQYALGIVLGAVLLLLYAVARVGIS
ncbi:MAG: NADH-quinone oxidoreductase subunit L [Actinobacteria bacterium]|nr:NADH-quinone oxidoreductase subunit L [Actinomycetota bacterium]